MLNAVRLPLKTLKFAMAIGIATLNACVLGPTADPGLERAIKDHYAKHATEEDGHCRTPQIDTIQSHQTIDTSERDGEVMTVRYSYFDRSVDMDADWGAFFHLSQPCGGITERDFSLTRTDLGYRVTDMTGERREAGRSN